MKKKSTFHKAHSFCAQKGMQLYRTDSLKANEILKTTAKRTFGESGRAFISGRDNDKCQTISGTGKLKYDLCAATYTFFCEYVGEGNLFESYWN